MAEIFEYYNTNDDIEQTAYYRYWKAQTFTPLQAHKITSVKLKLWKKGNPGTVTVSIRILQQGSHQVEIYVLVLLMEILYPQGRLINGGK